MDKRNECIGCGFCCWKTPCARGAMVYGTSAPCGGLVWDGTRHWCQLAIDNLEMMTEMIHIGAGCCSSMNSWRHEPLQDRTKWEAK